VSYGDRSMLYQSLRVGSRGRRGIRVILAVDGGSIGTRVADKTESGGGLHVVILPATATQEAAFSAR